MLQLKVALLLPSLLLLVAMCPVGVFTNVKHTPVSSLCANSRRKQQQQQRFGKRSNCSGLTQTQTRQLLLIDGLQVEAEGYFDIIEQPEQFIEVDMQIAPNTKGNFDAKSPHQVQQLRQLATAQAEAEAAAQAVAAAGATKKPWSRGQTRLPAFLFNEDDAARIQSNTKSIEDDPGRNFFYEPNWLAEGNYTLQQRIPKQKQKLQRMALQRRLFKQLKGKRIDGTKKHVKRKAKYHTKHTKNRHHSKNIAPHDFTSLLPISRTLRTPQRQRRAVTAKRERIWDFGVIPYAIDTMFSDEHKALFMQAMRHWENYTCIKFVEWEPKMHPNYIFFTVKNCGCCSFVGKRGQGRQAISIGRNCEKFGIVVHELGHVIGFWHEHTRTDRDEHIIINKANIMKGQEYNFDVLSPEDVDSLGLPYDYNSIMHYAKNTFSKSVYLDTIQPIGITDTQRVDIGQRKRLSSGDISQANLLYKCVTCGRTFQQNLGHILSPHYRYTPYSTAQNIINIEDVGSGDYDATDYDKSLEKCEWRITATNGERIILQLHKLHLLQSANCAEDYLEVRDGYWHKSPVIKKLCGNASAETIISDSSRMLISYVNRNAIKGFRGFIADFEVVCGGDIFLSEDRRIDSPNYPFKYLPDRECIWRISVPDSNQVALKFKSFELENHDNCVYDYVEIRDGNSTDSELIGIFCGDKMPPSIKSNSNQMYIKFVSDGSVQKVGFSALFMQEIDECKSANHGCQQECINTLGSYRCGCYASYELQADGKSCEDACGGIIDATIPNATLNSPSYPDVYPISKECVWELVAPPNHAVFLNFTYFDLEGTKFQYTDCNYDYLVVYSKFNDSRLKKIGVYCGHELPPTLKSEQNILRLEFFSDKSIQHTGFTANIHVDSDECSINNGGCQHYCQNTFGSYVCSCRNGYSLHENRHNCTETKCKFEITSSYGSIYSPNYPDYYPRNTYCFWHFRTVLGHRVQLTFHEFEVEDHQECIYDYVAIYDGKSENSSTLGIYCGGRTRPYAVVASTNEMFMVLRTDAGLQRKGFTATHSTECGGYLRATNRTQVFYSHPRYGSRVYRRNMYCNWRIQADSESSVKIKFLQFEVEYSERCEYDSVEIMEDMSYMRNTNHGRFCGNRKPPTIISYSDTLLIRFQTDESTSLRGFAVSFVAVEPPDDDLIDDLDPVTPFPGYMKSVYYASSRDYDNDF